MTRTTLSRAAALLATGVALGFAGCASDKVKYIDPASNEGVTTVSGIDFHDWGMAAEKATNDLLESGVLRRADGARSVIMMSTIRNNTAEHVDTDLLTKKMRVAILKSGQGITTTAVTTGGPEDSAFMGVRELRGSSEFDQSTVQKQNTGIAPNFSLSGKIIQVDSSAGKVRQSAFAFQLSITDLKTGLATWETEVPIIKQGKRNGVGW